jgi:plasmid stability protein
MEMMATLTIRNLSPRVVKSLKSMAEQNRRSMEQEVRELLEDYAAGRETILSRIEAAWTGQSRRPSAREIDKWIEAGRE